MYKISVSYCTIASVRKHFQLTFLYYKHFNTPSIQRKWRVAYNIAVFLFRFLLRACQFPCVIENQKVYLKYSKSLTKQIYFCSFWVS